MTLHQHHLSVKKEFEEEVTDLLLDLQDNKRRAQSTIRLIKSLHCQSLASQLSEVEKIIEEMSAINIPGKDIKVMNLNNEEYLKKSDLLLTLQAEKQLIERET